MTVSCVAVPATAKRIIIPDMIKWQVAYFWGMWYKDKRTEDRGQKTENRRQKTEDRKQRTENRRQKNRGQKTEDRIDGSCGIKNSDTKANGPG